MGASGPRCADEGLYDPPMKLRAVQGEALAEAQLALRPGKGPDSAPWPVVQRRDGGPGPRQGPGATIPRPRAVIVALREAPEARPRPACQTPTIFVTREPWPDVRPERLLACDVEADRVRRLPNPIDGRRRRKRCSLPGHEAVAQAQGRERDPLRRSRGTLFQGRLGPRAGARPSPSRRRAG